MTDPRDVPRARLINAVLERIDVNGVLDQVEVDQLLDRVDVDALLERVDVDRLLDRVDVDRLLDRVDVDRLIDRVDVDRLLKVGELVARSTSQVAGSTLDVLRRQAVALDTLMMRFVDRVLGRDPDVQPAGPPALVPESLARPHVVGPVRTVVSGFYAGALSRLLAYLIDATISFSGFGLLAGFVVTSINTVFGVDIEWDWRAGALGLFLFAGWLFLYFWFGIAVAGRTLGMSLVGIKVVTYDGQPIGPVRAATRTVVMPFSIITVLGLVGIVVGPRHRALHDHAAKTAVVYDWGDRPAELPAPLSKWLSEKDVV
jgi:uncharacterized RDD family membrane protein YckC